MKWERRTEIIGGVPFTHLEPVPEPGGPVNFDGGCRQLPPTPPRVEWTPDRSDPGWESITLEDGSDLFWPGLGR